MKDHRIVYTNAEGKVGIINPAPEWLDAHPDNTMERLIEKDAPKGATGARIIHKSEIPEDYFFDAFHDDGTTLSIHPEKAKNVKLKWIRFAREKKFPALDSAYHMAHEKDDKEAMAKIAAQKQALRDLPQTLDFTGMSFSEMKSHTPDILK